MSYSQAATTIRSILAQANTLDNQDRAKLVAVAIARALALRLPLPTSPVGNLRAYYTVNFDQQVIDVVAGFNECMVIDTNETLAQTFNFYRLRYDMVFEAQSFGTLLPAMAATLTEYFPESICGVMRRELERHQSEDNYYSSWGQVVAAVIDGLTGEEEIKGVQPVRVGAMC